MTAAPHPVRTLADLPAWSSPGPGLAVLGHPVAHSLSPAMHTAALAVLADGDPVFRSWSYDKFDIEPADLPLALGLLHDRGFAGLNLTVPHKETGLLLADSADEYARWAGAANTLIRTVTGWHAANTDGPGFAAAVHGELGSELGGELHGRPVILLGAGGSAHAAALQCLLDGVAELWIGNRSSTHLSALLAKLRPLARNIPLHGFALDDLPADCPAGALVVNATSLGLRGEPNAPLDLRRLRHPSAVLDLIYNPPETALLRQARELALPHANGLTMLVHQGALALSRWTGRPAPAHVMLRAAQRALHPPQA